MCFTKVNINREYIYKIKECFVLLLFENQIIESIQTNIEYLR